MSFKSSFPKFQNILNQVSSFFQKLYYNNLPSVRQLIAR